MVTQACDQALDFYLFDELLSDDERLVREHAEFPFELIPKLAELNIVGGTLVGYGCPALSSVASGVATMELSRGDGSVDTFYGVTSGLAMDSIYYCGSEEQRQQWLPAMAKLEKIGAFGLSEPNIGSDAAHLQTRATHVGDRYVLNGEKKWIGNASFADVTVIWARNEETNEVNGFLVEKGTPGFNTTVIEGKIAKRAVLNAHIVLNNCEIPEGNRLANADSFRDTSTVLRHTRPGVGWAAVGHALAGFEYARAYAMQRQQFGRPIAGFQLIQHKLVQMLGDVTAMQLLMWRLAKLRDEGKMTDGMAALAKQTCAAKARQVVALARETLGGNGVLLEHHVARHFADMEAVYTYEGTNEINMLVVGREITGIAAFV